MTINPWNVPLPPKRGDARKSITYRAVGHALSDWEYFEFSLNLVFRVICKTEWDIPLIRAYGSIMTYRGRAEMIESAADAYFRRHQTKSLQSEFRRLMNMADRFAARRNEVAHGRVERYCDFDPSKRGWCLFPSGIATNKREFTVETFDLRKPERLTGRVTKPKYVYSSVEIDIFGQGFWDLAVQTGWLAGEIVSGQIREQLAEHEPQSLQRFDETSEKIRKKRPEFPLKRR